MFAWVWCWRMIYYMYCLLVEVQLASMLNELITQGRIQTEYIYNVVLNYELSELVTVLICHDTYGCLSPGGFWGHPKWGIIGFFDNNYELS